MRCRFCGTQGHNKLSCPKVKEFAVIANQRLASGEISDPYHLPYHERWALNIVKHKEKTATAAKEARAAGTSIRKCSYCSEAGHTRAKCGNLNTDKATFIEYERRYRNAVALWFKHSGIGIGAIIQRANPEYESHLVMVKDTKDFFLTLFNGDGGSCIIGEYLTREGWEGYTTGFSIPHGSGWPYADGRYGWKLVGTSHVPFEFPAEYLTASAIEGFINQVFDEKPKRQYRYRNNSAHIGTFHTQRPELSTYLAKVDLIENAANEAYKQTA
jgi:hypothetical protein